MHFFSFKGFGVFAMRSFEPGSFLLHYPGDFITEEEADDREKVYAKDAKGCYMYFFDYQQKTFW